MNEKQRAQQLNLTSHPTPEHIPQQLELAVLLLLLLLQCSTDSLHLRTDLFCSPAKGRFCFPSVDMWKEKRETCNALAIFTDLFILLLLARSLFTRTPLQEKLKPVTEYQFYVETYSLPVVPPGTGPKCAILHCRLV